ncbi:MAG: hypothetical protein LAO05_15415 [Acidobacteriia bacterium]|nr:hypothetical protein [Terriglobia bacterium]
MLKKPRRKKPQPKHVAKRRAVIKRFPKSVTVTVTFDERKKRFVVDPGVAEVRAGGTVSFRSKVGPLTVFVPTPTRAHALFPRSRGAEVTIPSKGKKLIVSKAKIKKAVVYWYCVYCTKHRTFAEASFPRLIVSP